jgi:tetratricopeptide (TPR) repeat protein
MNHLCLIVAFCLALPAGLSAGVEEDFAAVAAMIQRGDQLLQEGRDRAAMREYQQAQEALLKLGKVYPQWDPQVVAFRLRYVSERLNQWTGPAVAEPAAPGAELQALQSRINFLERSSQQYQAQINQLLTENQRLAARLREALAIRPAAQEPTVVAETQNQLEAATREVTSLQARVKELETELAGIPKPDEARQNLRLLEETRKNLNLSVAEAETLRRQVAELRAAPPEKRTPAPAPATSQLAEQLQAVRVAQSAAEMELQRLRSENEKLQLQLTAMAGRDKPAAVSGSSPAGGTLKRIDRARLALAEGRPDEAIRLLEAELATSPANVEGLYLLGRARLDSGDFTRAGAALKRALELAPELGALHLELARLYHRQPAPDAALARWHYHKAIGLGSPRVAAFEREIGWEQSPAAR